MTLNRFELITEPPRARLYYQLYYMMRHIKLWSHYTALGWQLADDQWL